MARPKREDFERLLAFRVSLRTFQHWSEEQAQSEGVTHVQHQLLVAVKGHPGTLPPAMGDVAEYLLLRPHSAVELVDRAELAGLVRRTPDPADGRVVRVELTPSGDRIVGKLLPGHLDRLHELAKILDELMHQYDSHLYQPGSGSHPAPPEVVVGQLATAADRDVEDPGLEGP